MEKNDPGKDETIRCLEDIITGLRIGLIHATDLETCSDYGDGGPLVTRRLDLRYREMVA
jgi:hypothetical protein